MKVYFLFENLEVLHLEKLEEYRKHVLPMVKKYGGSYLFVGGNPRTLEGSWEPGYMVLIEFPDKASAQAWYYSEEYALFKSMRLGALKANGILLEGLPH